MALGVGNNIYGQTLTGALAQVTGNTVDLRASNGSFVFQLSGSGTNAGFGNSANVKLEHSIDLTAWIQLALTTASGTGTLTHTVFSAGAYSFVRATTPAVYSGATGTGVIFASICANPASV